MPRPDSTRVEGRLTVLVQPRAGHDGISVLDGATVRVRVTAPPVGGAANEAVLDLLAHALGCARSAVEILRGHTARTKLIRITGLSTDDVMARLMTRLARS